MLLCCLPQGKAQNNYAQLTNYQQFYGIARGFGKSWITLRRFEDHSRYFILLVNPQTLETRVDLAESYQVQPMSMKGIRSMFKASPYGKALMKSEQQSVQIQDAGIESGVPKDAGISLTADLCPAHRPLDRRIFTDIITGFQKVERPVPIALSVSGIWMQHHIADLDWLKQLQQNHEINITWINHSYNHRVSAKAPLKTNFLLEPGTDVNYEVLETEKAMLKNGLLPSVFFRFPGLVSDQQLVYKITNFGLIPVGTDAWLAKGQQPHAGSIVLIHGNGNEPTGVADFIKLLQSKAGSIANKQWLLYDLRETVEDEFEGGK
ncbi:polysaccharide deacetylase [Mucilaginibacter sp. PAMC 26640]|nr:polysaccharide deacetylase [Mucilaginibacter sp. PAMC 26640]